MTEDYEIQKLIEFVKILEKSNAETTGVSAVSLSTKLYNVSGSTTDPNHVPNHSGESWKQLLISYGINHNCYVTSPPGAGSHANFSVGGHMTKNSSGTVPTGGSCYLMPLCYWHNSTGLNGVAFTIKKNTKMLKLSGYMQGELALTFKVRLPSALPFALIYNKDGIWDYQDLTADQAENLTSEIQTAQASQHILIERVQGEDRTTYAVRSHNLPT